MLGHLRSQRTAKLQIFTSWSLSVPTVGAVCGEDDVRSTLFGHWMAHFFTTPAVAGSGDTICFGSLESPIPSPAGMRVPPVFEPSQAFLFGSLDFVADRLGVLHLREETHDPAPIRETFSIDFGTRDLNGAASALHSEQTLCSNPTVSNTCTFIRPLFATSHRSSGGTAPPTP